MEGDPGQPVLQAVGLKALGMVLCLQRIDMVLKLSKRRLPCIWECHSGSTNMHSQYTFFLIGSLFLLLYWLIFVKWKKPRHILKEGTSVEELPLSE